MLGFLQYSIWLPMLYPLYGYLLQWLHRAVKVELCPPKRCWSLKFKHLRMWPYLEIRCLQMTKLRWSLLCPIERESLDRQTDTPSTPCAYWSYTATTQGNYQKVGERPGMDLSLLPPEVWPCLHLGFGLLASQFRDNRYLSYVSQFVVFCYSCPRKLIQSHNLGIYPFHSHSLGYSVLKVLY